NGIVGDRGGNFYGYNSISGDGTSGVFGSTSTNLIPNDSNSNDTFVIQFRASKPALVSPTDGALTLSQNVTFNWIASLSATQYQIQIASDSAFTNVLYDVTQVTTTYTQSFTSNTYYWRVRGKNSLGDGPWSDTYQFEIGITENTMVNEQQLFTMAQSRLTDNMTFALFDITPTGIITTVQFSDGGVVTGTVKLSVTNGLMTIMVEDVTGGNAEQQIAMYDVVPSLIMAMFDETLPDDYVTIESLTLTDVGISANLLMPNNP
ncbi:MAG TPA: hypothetical protein PLZ51_13095, partial [Aggregatilineales bacterium]|nr:hypothetical protein [Aggregatilineales bacterium]